jgi:VWFA-related protein
VLVYVIEYETERDFRGIARSSDEEYAWGTEYLLDLSRGSGGRLFNASNVPSLTEAFCLIAEDLRHQYTICYYPGEAAGDGSHRTIRVTVDRADVKIQARRGYRPVVK